MSEPRVHNSGVGAWFDHHAYSVVSGLGRVFRKPWAALLTIGVMAVALALPLGLWLVLGNVERLGGSVEQSREIGLFLKQDVAPARVQSLLEELRARSNIADVRHVTPEQALEDLRARGGLDGIIDAAGEANPLPHVLVVSPAGDETTVAESLRTVPEVDFVQHDVQWRQRLDTWLRFGGRVVWVLGLLLGLGALLVVGNTVRLDIQSRREEIGVLQLLGATDGFIRRPFLYLGAWYGVASGALAIALLVGVGIALRAPLAELSASYGSGFALSGFTWQQALVVLGGATAIGWLGAGFVAGHFLRQTRPTDA